MIVFKVRVQHLKEEHNPTDKCLILIQKQQNTMLLISSTPWGFPAAIWSDVFCFIY